MKQWALEKEEDWEEGTFADGATDLDFIRLLGIPEDDEYYQHETKEFIREYL
jgi:hypothetical protein